ncbi:hypothetical protein C2W64_00733 [Brevibacillus laterosporus]|nr:hypothetical protein C2W64_00733 [Brevibacillus laterosporus]
MFHHLFFSLYVSYLEELLMSASNWLVSNPTKFMSPLEQGGPM